MTDQPSFLDRPGPRIFTIGSGEDFQTVLAKGVLAAIDKSVDPFALHDAIVLVPTRRAVRTLSAAFLTLVGTDKAILLPQILPIGDIEADEPPFLADPIPLDIAPQISPNKRIFSLAQIVMHRAKASGQPVSLSSALAESAAIAALLDTAAHEGVQDFSLATEQFESFLQSQPEHIQRAARFLEIITEYWPKHLTTLGQIDPATHRAKMLQALHQQWSQNPTEKIVIAAGSTGSQKATAELLKTVTGLPNGCVVLPGLDQQMDEAAWQQVTLSPGHPQYGMAQLLGRWATDRNSVANWPHETLNIAQNRRRRIISEAMTPAKITSDWLERLAGIGANQNIEIAPLLTSALAGLSVVEAETEDEEALVLALAIRQSLNQPKQTAMLVTPDRALARRVRAALQRWSIEVDDSAGVPLPENPVGIFLKLCRNWWADPGDPSALLALLIHPLAAVGLERAQVLPLVRALDIDFLRGVRKHQDLLELIGFVAISKHERTDKLLALLQGLQKIITEAKIKTDNPISSFAQNHAKLAESLAATNLASGAAQLWRGKAGELANSLFRSLIEDSDPAGDTDLEGYARVFDFFAEQISVRPQMPKGGRVRILGPLEARQQSADLILLGALDEGIWPSLSTVDPFLPRALIKQIGLPDPERRLGLSAHDFTELACKQNVMLTRSCRRDGSPSIASRWIWRLQTLVDAAVGKQKRTELLRPKTDFLAYARILNQIDATHPAPEPFPKPPLSTRPKKLSVTRVTVLIRNPFAIYGQKILRLSGLDEIGQQAGPRERGNAIHNALQAWEEAQHNGPLELQANALQQLIIAQLYAAGFMVADLAVEGPAAARIAHGYLRWSEQRKQLGFSSPVLEKTGTIQLPIPDSAPIEISAKADRIERFGNQWAVLDYKTGSPPSAKQVVAGWDPQLPLTGAIIYSGGFSKHQIKPAEIGQLAYLQLSGGREPIKHKLIKLQKPNALTPIQQLVEEELSRVQQLFARFAKLDTPYRSQPRAVYTDSYSDFDHLARRAEWSAILDNEGDGK